MALDFLFQGDPLPSVTSTTETSTQFPKWYQQYLSQLIGRASAVAGEPYQPYEYPRIAGFTGDQTTAFDMTRDNSGIWQPVMTGAQTMTEQSSVPFDAAQFGQFFNPYVDQVVDRIGDLGARNLSEKLLPEVNDTFTNAGHFGSSRHADFTNRAVRDTQEAVLGQQGSALASGFESQMKAYEDAMRRKQSGGAQMSQIGTNLQGLGLRDAAAMEAIGQTQQGQTQRNLDLAYQDFLEQRDYPRTNVSFLSNVIRGLPMNTSTSSTTTGPASQGQMAPSGLAQLTGAGLGIYGLGQSMGWFAKGGKVKKKLPKPGGIPSGLGAFAKGKRHARAA